MKKVVRKWEGILLMERKATQFPDKTNWVKTGKTG
jgi:hypothetical protein